MSLITYVILTKFQAHSHWPHIPVPICPKCKWEFETKEEVFAHMKDAHGIDPEVPPDLHVIKDLNSQCIVKTIDQVTQNDILTTRP